MVPPPMVSATQQSSRIRARKAGKNTQSKRENRANGTVIFPIQPEGYDLTAPDAKRPAAAEPPKPAPKAPKAAKPARAAKAAK